MNNFHIFPIIGGSEEKNELIDIYLNYFGIINLTIAFNIKLNDKLKNPQTTLSYRSAENAGVCFTQDTQNGCKVKENCEWLEKQNKCIINDKKELSFKNFTKTVWGSNIQVYSRNETAEVFVNQFPFGYKFNIQYIIKIPETLAGCKFIFVYEYENVYYITFPTGHIKTIPNEQTYYSVATRNTILRFLFEDNKDKYVFCGHSEGCVMSQFALMQYPEDGDLWKAEIVNKCYSVGSGMFQNTFTPEQLQQFNKTYENRHLYHILFYYDATSREKGLHIDPYYLRRDNVNNIVITNASQLMNNFQNTIFINNNLQTIQEATKINPTTRRNSIFQSIKQSVKQSVKQMTTTPVKFITTLDDSLHNFNSYSAYFNKNINGRKPFLQTHI